MSATRSEKLAVWRKPQAKSAEIARALVEGGIRRTGIRPEHSGRFSLRGCQPLFVRAKESVVAEVAHHRDAIELVASRGRSDSNRVRLVLLNGERHLVTIRGQRRVVIARDPGHRDRITVHGV